MNLLESAVNKVVQKIPDEYIVLLGKASIPGQWGSKESRLMLTEGRKLIIELFDKQVELPIDSPGAAREMLESYDYSMDSVMIALNLVLSTIN